VRLAETIRRPGPDIALDGLAALPASLGQIVRRLQVHPELGAGVEKAGKPQCGIRSH
jgi:hypothetical protein